MLKKFAVCAAVMASLYTASALGGSDSPRRFRNDLPAF